MISGANNSYMHTLMYREFYALFTGIAKCGKLKVKFYSLSVRPPFLMFHELGKLGLHENLE